MAATSTGASQATTFSAPRSSAGSKSVTLTGTPTQLATVSTSKRGRDSRPTKTRSSGAATGDKSGAASWATGSDLTAASMAAAGGGVFEAQPRQARRTH